MQNDYNSPPWIVPNWPAPAHVKALTTLRQGGVSQAPFDTFNLALHVGDDPSAVAENHRRLREWAKLPSEPVWLNQVHGTEVVNLDELTISKFFSSNVSASNVSAQHLTDPNLSVPDLPDLSERIQADASVSFKSNQVCAVMTADCLPLVLCDQSGTRVAAVHAGWKGLAAGVIEATVQKLNCDPKTLMVWLGPAIGPLSFEVGLDVKNAFSQTGDETAFKKITQHENLPEKWHADLYTLATLRLKKLGISSIYGGGRCTYLETDSFFSYRRACPTGRMATLIWLEVLEF